MMDGQKCYRPSDMGEETEREVRSREAQQTTISPSAPPYNPTWHQRPTAVIDGSGLSNRKKGWYCPDCGAPADCSKWVCWRCGSEKPCQWRD